MRLADKLTALGIEIAHPDLRRIGRFRSPDQAFAVRRKSRPFFVMWCWVQSPRFTAASRHDPQMRNLGVRGKIDIFTVEHDPFPIRRRYWRADALQRHHVFEGEWM